MRLLLANIKQVITDDGDGVRVTSLRPDIPASLYRPHGWAQASGVWRPHGKILIWATATDAEVAAAEALGAEFKGDCCTALEARDMVTALRDPFPDWPEMKEIRGRWKTEGRAAFEETKDRYRVLQAAQKGRVANVWEEFRSAYRGPAKALEDAFIAQQGSSLMQAAAMFTGGASVAAVAWWLAPILGITYALAKMLLLRIDAQDTFNRANGALTPAAQGAMSDGVNTWDDLLNGGSSISSNYAVGDAGNAASYATSIGTVTDGRSNGDTPPASANVNSCGPAIRSGSTYAYHCRGVSGTFTLRVDATDLGTGSSLSNGDTMGVEVATSGGDTDATGWLNAGVDIGPATDSPTTYSSGYVGAMYSSNSFGRGLDNWDWTAAGAGISIPVVMHHRKIMGVS